MRKLKSKRTKKNKNKTQASHFTNTHEPKISLSHTPTHPHTKQTHLHSDTNKQVIFRGITHLITTCARALYKERERERKFIVVILKGYGGASEDSSKL